MDAAVWVAIAAAAISLGSIPYVVRSANAARRQAVLAAQQTEIQRLIYQDSASPYVVADLRPDEQSGQMLRLVIGNYGRTMATDVRIEFDPPLSSALWDERPGRAQQIADTLRDGLAAMPPGRVHEWHVDVVWRQFDSGHPLSYKATVRCNGPFGAVPELTYIIDVEQWRTAGNAAPGNFRTIADEVKAMSRQLERVAMVATDLRVAEEREPVRRTRRKSRRMGAR